MPQPIKVEKVEKLSETLDGATGIFLTDFTGLSVEQITELRREFRKADVEYLVVKNTLAKLSVQKVGFEQVIPLLNGPTGIAITKSDPISPIRVIFDFKKDNEKPEVKGAVVEGQLLDQKATEEMKNIPTKEVLIGQVLSAISSPITGFVGGLNQMITKLVYTLDAIKEQKE